MNCQVCGGGEEGHYGLSPAGIGRWNLARSGLERNGAVGGQPPLGGFANFMRADRRFNVGLSEIRKFPNDLRWGVARLVKLDND